MNQDINRLVADNLRFLREERGLSLAAAAKLAGVSKSLWSQVERGEVNPTISTLWKIAVGLKVSITRLTTWPTAEFEVVDTADRTPLAVDAVGFRNYPLFELEEGRPFELYYLELDPGATLTAEPHLPGCQEFITLFAGELTVRVADRELRAGTGAALRFPADRPHAYFSTGTETARLSMVIHYAAH